MESSSIVNLKRPTKTADDVQTDAVDACPLRRTQLAPGRCLDRTCGWRLSVAQQQRPRQQLQPEMRRDDCAVVVGENGAASCDGVTGGQDELGQLQHSGCHLAKA